MDRLRSLWQRQPEQSYVPVADGEDDDGDGDLVNSTSALQPKTHHRHDAPASTTRTGFYIEYSIFLLLGVSMLLGVVALFSSGSWAAFGALFQPFLKRHERAFNTIMALLLAYSAAAVWI